MLLQCCFKVALDACKRKEGSSHSFIAPVVFVSRFFTEVHSVCKEKKMDDDTPWCSLVPINVIVTELSCVERSSVLDWHPVSALRLELQKTVSHWTGSAAVSDLSGCYKLIVFDLFDSFDHRGTYNVPPWWMSERLTYSREGVILYLCCCTGQFLFKLGGLPACQGRVSSFFPWLQRVLWQDCMLACLCACAA